MAGPGPALVGIAGAVATIAVGAAVGLYGDASGPLGALELATVDARFALRGPAPQQDPLCLVTVDDDSLRAMGHRLERRVGFGELVQALRAAGARAIAIDALFPEAERVLSPALVKDLDDWLAAHPDHDAAGSPLLDAASAPAARGLREARALLARTRAEANGDAALASGFAGGDVILALHASRTVGFSGLGPELDKAAYGQQVPGRRMPPRMDRVIGSLPVFHEAAGALGVITVDMGGDGRTIRSVQLGRTVDRHILMPFGVAVAAAALDVPRALLAYDAAEGVLHLGDRAVRADVDHRLTLNHRGGPGAFCSIPAAGVLTGDGVDVLKDKVAIVTYTDLGNDTVRTPYGLYVPGAVIHATLASNIIHDDALATASTPAGLAVALALGLLGAGAFTTRLRLRAAWRVGFVVVASLLWAGLAHALFTGARLIVPVAGPLLTIAVAAIAALGAAYGAEGQTRRRLRRAFAHYLADEVIEELLRNPGSLALGGERRTLTVLFSDIRGFTTISEELEPLALVELLNAYFTPMTRAVLENRGLLDKYIGDAVMAVFGAPVPRETHADDALACALTMHTRLQQLRGSAALHGRVLDIGIGINTGEVIVGNMGSSERFDYTVAGDAVNMASRVEGLTRPYGAFCLVGESTRHRASPRFRFRDVDLVRAKGKRQPTAIFELLGDDEVRVVDYADLRSWQEGLAAYRAGRFAAARDMLKRFAMANPHDAAAPLLLSRMGDRDEAPPGWDGVFDHATK